MKKFINEEFGFGSWSEILSQAGLEGKTYSPADNYPDEDAVAILEAASEISGKSVRDLQFQFGKTIGPSLLSDYSGLIDSDWNTLDLIEHTEEKIHTEVRKRTSNAMPPDLGDVERKDDKVLILHYTSDRNMCDVAKGISKAVAESNGETLEISEERCMHDGDEECELYLSLA